MRLFVPFGQRGTLSLEHLPGNDGTGVLAVNCEPALDTSLDPQLTLEIHHKGVTSIYAHSHAFVYLSGVLGLETISLEAHSYLQAKTGEIYSHSLSVLMGEASHCTVRTIRVERLHLRQTCVSYFEVKKLEHTFNSLILCTDVVEFFTEEYHFTDFDIGKYVYLRFVFWQSHRTVIVYVVDGSAL